MASLLLDFARDGLSRPLGPSHTVFLHTRLVLELLVLPARALGQACV